MAQKGPLMRVVRIGRRRARRARLHRVNTRIQVSHRRNYIYLMRIAMPGPHFHTRRTLRYRCIRFDQTLLVAAVSAAFTLQTNELTARLERSPAQIARVHARENEMLELVLVFDRARPQLRKWRRGRVCCRARARYLLFCYRI